MKEENFVPSRRSSLDNLDEFVVDNLLGSNQVVGELDPDRSQRMIGSKVVVDESIVPDKARSSGQDFAPTMPALLELSYLFGGPGGI